MTIMTTTDWPWRKLMREAIYAAQDRNGGTLDELAHRLGVARSTILMARFDGVSEGRECPPMAFGLKVCMDLCALAGWGEGKRFEAAKEWLRERYLRSNSELLDTLSMLPPELEAKAWKRLVQRALDAEPLESKQPETVHPRRKAPR